MKGRRRGFTLVELLIVVLLLGILATLALPNVRRAVTKARATEVLGDLNVVKQAALNFQADNSVWPPDVGRGTIPQGMEPYLPSGFSFTADAYVLDYDDWSDTDAGFVGVTVVTDDQELGLAFLDLVGANSWTNGNNKFTWVIEWTE